MSTYKDKKVVRLSPEIYQAIAGQAQAERRSVNAQVEHMLATQVVIAPPSRPRPRPTSARTNADVSMGSTPGTDGHNGNGTSTRPRTARPRPKRADKAAATV